jgi:peptide deformylase
MIGGVTMAVKEILQYGDSKLNAVCEPIKEINQQVFDIIKDLKDTLYDGTGIGLAAPQIGILKRVILIDLRVGGDPIILINPKIVETSGSECDYEGCLSYLGYEGEVVRPTSIVVEGINEKGEMMRYNAKGLLARAFCHEIDHLDGVLYMSKAETMYEVVEEDDEE